MIDFSNFEPKTRGGFPWEVIVPEDGLIRVIVHDEKNYVFVNDRGEVMRRNLARHIGTDSVSGLVDQFSLVPKRDAADDWRAGWRPDSVESYVIVDATGGSWSFATWTAHAIDYYRVAVGNCYPDTPRGRALAEARAKYEPLIGEIAATDKPEEVFAYLRAVTARSKYGAAAPAPDAVPPLSFSQLQACADHFAAVSWLDSGYRLTIEEAEA